MDFQVSHLVLVALLFCSVCAKDLDEEWENFKSTFQKSYQPREEGMRRKTWEDNIAEIQRHNSQYELGLKSFITGINKYSDMHLEEFVKSMNGYKCNDTVKRSVQIFKPSDNANLPETVDWRSQGIVTPVKDQAQCGSCWAFSSTGSLEGQHALKSGNLVSLSEQNLMDCSIPDGRGCEGGFPYEAFEYIKKNGGIDTEQSYPYTAKDGICHFNKMFIGATNTGYVNISKGDEEALKKAVATVGPISVAIDASLQSFKNYKSGIYDDSNCKGDVIEDLDHAVLIVGYGTENGTDYWLVKNSWGTSWGMDGYIQMVRNKKNQCGIATGACYPIV